MKKFLTIALSCVIFSFLNLLSVAKVEELPAPIISSDKIYVAKPEAIPLEVLQSDGVITEPIEPNSTIYFVITNANRSEDLTGLRVMVDDIQQGGEFLGEPTVEYLTLYDSTGNPVGYSYVAALPVLGLAGETEADVTGKITIAKRLTGSEQFKFRFEITDSLLKQVETYSCTGRTCIIDFKDSEKAAVISFYELARLEITSINQGKIDLGFSSQALTDIADAYPEQRLRFLSWEAGPIFNREGMLYIYAQQGEFLYEVTPNGLRDLSISFSAEAGAFVLQTRHLATYVIAPKELGEFIEAEPRPNPPTGAKIWFN